MAKMTMYASANLATQVSAHRSELSYLIKRVERTVRVSIEGKNCEKIDKCLLRDNICLNGGTCVMKGNKLACDCPANFEPPYCQKPRVKSIYCDENVCKNGGTCIHTDMDKLIGMKCVCKSGYTGVFCETSKTFEWFTENL